VWCALPWPDACAEIGVSGSHHPTTLRLGRSHCRPTLRIPPSLVVQACEDWWASSAGCAGLAMCADDYQPRLRPSTGRAARELTFPLLADPSSRAPLTGTPACSRGALPFSSGRPVAGLLFTWTVRARPDFDSSCSQESRIRLVGPQLGAIRAECPCEQVIRRGRGWWVDSLSRSISGGYLRLPRPAVR